MGKKTSDEELTGFVKRYSNLVQRMLEITDPTGQTAGAALRAHLGDDAVRRPVVSENFSPWDHVNVQRALDAMQSNATFAATWEGIVGDHRYSDLNLGILLGGGRYLNDQVGPLMYRNQPTSVDEYQACISLGFATATYRGEPIGILLRLGDQHSSLSGQLRLEVASTNRETGEAFLQEIRTLTNELNIYRGQMMTFSVCDDGSLKIEFMRREAVVRSDIVLPPGVMESIERQVLGVAEHRDELRRLGQHLKRGVLLHGAPGSGKTLSIRYLASRMSDTTVIVLTGKSLAAIQPSCQMARLLAPSLVVIEDVDLVANERHQPGMETNPLLFTLLNEMDGVAGDADVTFVLTTNRPDILEPALAQRPGRIDLAVEVPLPNAKCRRALLRRYGAPVGLKFASSKDIVARTEGVSASFVKELVRKATLSALIEGESVSEAHVDQALDDLLTASASLTRSLLGAAPSK